MTLAIRWLKFNAVGLIGVGVQLASLSLFVRGFGLHYLAATVLAVETAILHNFVWHERWTWKERTGSGGLPARLARFHLANGAVSLVSNILLMRLLAGGLGVHYLAANLLAVALTSLANFLLGETVVFRA